MIEAGSHTTNEYRFLPAGEPTADFRLIAPRVDDQEYYPDHRDGLFYIRTNDAGKNFRVVTAPVATPGRDHWPELVPLDPDHPLEDFDLFQMLRRRHPPQARPAHAGSPPLHRVGQLRSNRRPGRDRLPRAHLLRRRARQPHLHHRLFRYSYQSLVSPPSVYEYNVARAHSDVPIGESKLLKQQEVPGGFDSAHYASERLWITASDGTQSPHLHRLSPRHFHRDGANPLYVYGYGSYGYPLPVGFRPPRLSLLDRGVVMAYAHIRGGGELGDAWHDAGKMQLKRNTFTDFIAATEQLVARGYGNANRVAIEGGSAGGLLMGAVVNLAAAPESPASSASSSPTSPSST